MRLSRTPLVPLTGLTVRTGPDTITPPRDGRQLQGDTCQRVRTPRDDQRRRPPRCANWSTESKH
ncbi:hypothetical protein FRACA_2200003 [Frankia canadensis]|uniref:Uncharacterized protein n=1 Tax=Frankia canadensis TaxID=1836972 RepID=A0A2I2KR31_9ACTN|nr:hypothetical protein FRACA_2200003 [Frankia canadensis]SOU55399.1 hypothetical protein FRACA_2200003 [Frankia canadensis]